MENSVSDKTQEEGEKDFFPYIVYGWFILMALLLVVNIIRIVVLKAESLE